ncbi:hypothetical protein [Pontibacter fetidus]|uniref:Uncharacterized protein n=1 Tax=Pontibacter fetidus TaxID=2700082 RepID=A0A6B2H1Y2_9BACT|nr:hypothetical protein [Pontibacter fetidus]NDK54616.1 hypothetical protein [Pontibacter fetidus]
MQAKKTLHTSIASSDSNASALINRFNLAFMVYAYAVIAALGIAIVANPTYEAQKKRKPVLK